MGISKPSQDCAKHQKDMAVLSFAKKDMAVLSFAKKDMAVLSFANGLR